MLMAAVVVLRLDMSMVVYMCRCRVDVCWFRMRVGVLGVAVSVMVDR